jgi:hypothetical protein
MKIRTKVNNSLVPSTALYLSLSKKYVNPIKMKIDNKVMPTLLGISNLLKSLNSKERKYGKKRRKTPKKVLAGASLMPSRRKYINGKPAKNIATAKPSRLAKNLLSRYFIQ